MSEPFDFLFSSLQSIVKRSSGGQFLNKIKPCGHVIAITLTSDSATMVVATITYFITLNTDTCEKLQVFDGHTHNLTCVAISPDDLTVVSGGDDHKVIVWDLPTGKLKMTLTGHEDSVSSVAISPTGEKIASGSSDNTVRIWSLLDAGKLLFTLKGHAYNVQSVIFTPGAAGQQVISGSWDGSLRVWSVDYGVNIHTIDVGSCVYCLAVNSSGDKVICGCTDSSIRMYGLKGPHTKQLIRRMEGHDDFVLSVTITPDEQHIISGSGDNSIIKWRMDSGLKVQTLANHHHDVTSVACCPSALIYDREIELKFSGRLVNTYSKKIVYAVNPQTIVETNEDNVILREEEIVVTTIKASDAAKALEWKEWILAVQKNLSLPKEERLKTGSRIMTRYKSDWLQVMNITESAKVQYLPKNAINLVMYYIYK